MSKIVIINGNPKPKSLCGSLSETYRDAAIKSGSEVQYFSLGAMQFDPVLRQGYEKRQDFEPDLQVAIDAILWADHIVLFFPTWWGGLPAVLKGFIDRTFLPSITFKYHKNDPFWDRLLVGKSAHCFILMDTPRWYFSFIYGDPIHKQIKRTILEFCGVKPVKLTTFANVRGASAQKKAKWHEMVRKFGASI